MGRATSVAQLLREREVRATPTVRGRLCKWVDRECTEHGVFRSTYCRLPPTARSTIALAWSPDAALLASTHGDHVVRIFNVTHGECVRTLVGHSRTPWTVKFHPHSNHIVVSGALDAEIRVWATQSGACLFSRRLGSTLSAISSISFHSSGLSLIHI